MASTTSEKSASNSPGKKSSAASTTSSTDSNTSGTALSKAEAKAARKAERRLAAQQAQQEAREQHAKETNGRHVVVTHEDKILEAIDQLRKRKARPDADRICNYLLRKFSVDARDTIADLHKLIATEKVIQVDYKGNTSYRNASKWTRLSLYKNRPEGFVKDKINSQAVAGAFAELVVEEPDYLDTGVPADRLVEHLLDGVLNPTSRRVVEDFLGKEVSTGNLALLSNGNYSLVDGSVVNSGSEDFSPSHRNGDVSPKGSKNSTPSKEVKNLCNPKKVNGMHFDEEDYYSYETSRQCSPKSDSNPKAEACWEIIVGDERSMYEKETSLHEFNGKANGHQKDEYSKQNGKHSTPFSEIEEIKISTEPQTNKRRYKSGRKQRILVRDDDDSPNLIFSYEDYEKENDKRDDGNDRLSEDGDDDHNAGRDSTNPSPTPSNHNAGSFRSARRKRAKKVFDPSDNMVVKKKRGRQPKVVPPPQEMPELTRVPILKESPKDPHRHCSMCSRDKQETLIACRDCTSRVHPSCVYTAEEIILKANTSWQCDDCKTCAACFETSEAGSLISCYSCGDAFHHSCHVPRITVTKSRWFCGECNHKKLKPLNHNSNQSTNWSHSASESQLNNNSVTSVSNPQGSPPRNAPDMVDEDNSRDAIDPNIPDASDWGTEQVYQYFARLFPKEAETFRNHEIDGSSLLLLKRKDVLTGLDLLLGPALKIWRHVLKLQLRRDDPKFYWL
ncbi:hypothetical protein QAD02_009728 [Eretmocerus hayati]|uniref:Uncharacterized protein n=1 Tax=Eretmocerus hayati TaxID=131215 RepID=A0ACC2NA63_9HYME|nr:hypothetical protein QAD02_009728 [Eretmocerus hayati]